MFGQIDTHPGGAVIGVLTKIDPLDYVTKEFHGLFHPADDSL